jgi:hypothetical protein
MAVKISVQGLTGQTMPKCMRVVRRLKYNAFNTEVLNTSCLFASAERPDSATRSRKWNGKRAHGRLEQLQAPVLACIVTQDRLLKGAWSTLWNSTPHFAERSRPTQCPVLG